MTEVEIIGEVDTKGRVTVPKNVRDMYGLKPRDRIRLKVVEILPRRSFIRECKGALKNAGDAVKLLHKESPFR
jgi:bifunctional DNA-binding transcriptional regulator/antitoxin component of YhaV-PrlF toxin-antitoxin module